jgi:hypothetical protein
MTPIYVLVIGSYDHSGLLGVYLSRVDAQRAADALNSTHVAQECYLQDAHVETFPLNPVIDDVIAERFWAFTDEYDERFKDYERRKREVGIDD